MAETVFSELANSAYRRAGMTLFPGIAPSSTEYTEAIRLANWLLASWSLDGLKIFRVDASRYRMAPLKAGYYLGPSGTDWLGDRPNRIIYANVVDVSTSPEVHYRVRVVSDASEWAELTMPELSAAMPMMLYSDGSVPDALIQLYPRPTVSNDLELFTEKAISGTITASTDILHLPNGYELAIETNLAVQVVSMNPRMTKLGPIQVAELRKDAGIALQAVKNKDFPQIMRINDFSMEGGGQLPPNFSPWFAR